MRTILQRVSRAKVTIENQTVAEIGRGLLILVGIGQTDESADAYALAERCANLRIFEDSDGKSNLSLLDVRGEALVVSQFTLFADTRKGRRPSFTGAALPELAEPLVEEFAQKMESMGIRIGRGKFGAHMIVELVNDGPYTVIVEDKAS
jgi:D-aminoacyl-tRNA deacylase